MKKNIYTIPVVLLFSGCASMVPSHDEAVASIKNQVKTPQHFSQSASSQKVADHWIRTFKDPTLNRLVNEAQAHNPNLLVAKSRVERAVALTSLTESALKPNVGLRAGYRDNNAEGANEISFGAARVSWEPDLWGRVKNSVSADQELTQASMADYNFARQSLAANTAKAWFRLNANSEIVRFSKKIVQLQEKGLQVLTAREKIGQGNKRDVHVSKALVASAKQSYAASRAAKERAQRAVEVLVGRYPSAALRAKKLYAVPAPMPAAGLPSGLLERRPDLIAAEARVAAAFHQEASAKLLHLPALNLSLGVGPNSINNAITNLAAGIFAPLYTGGAIEAQVDVTTADQKAAIASYAHTALKAFQEVENALSREKYLAKQYKYMKTAASEYKIAYKMTTEKYRIGESSILDVIVTQGEWIRAEITRVQIAKERLINRVNLYLALGGSFE